jgi:hypothetical protein
MLFLLDAHNVVDYLFQAGLCSTTDLTSNQIHLRDSKNFNLQVDFPSGSALLVKQERWQRNGNPKGEFQHEVVLYQLFQAFPDLSVVRSLVPEILHFDVANSILVIPYFNDCRDLDQFYKQKQQFPAAIATAVAVALATVHRATFERQDYREFLAQHSPSTFAQPITALADRWNRLEPEIFSSMSQDAIKFFTLYQRYASLGQAMSAAQQAFIPCCLTHNDLKLDNLLLNLEGLHDFPATEYSGLPLSDPSMIPEPVIRLIDWEQWTWGDPAFDLGTLLASYLRFWLNSIPMNTVMDMDTALQLAVYPLEQLQPSLVALVQGYFRSFPEILRHDPGFLTRTMQFTGLALIQRLETNLQYLLPFDNTKIGILQVAKTLLCRPEQSIPIVFGTTPSNLAQLNSLPA